MYAFVDRKKDLIYTNFMPRGTMVNDIVGALGKFKKVCKKKRTHNGDDNIHRRWD